MYIILTFDISSNQHLLIISWTCCIRKNCKIILLWVFVCFSGPEVSSCCFYGFRNKADCGLSEVLITDTPKECTSMIYSAVNIDLNYKVSDHVSVDNFSNITLLLKLIYKHNMILLRKYKYFHV
jgi:hypothetical protein